MTDTSFNPVELEDEEIEIDDWKNQHENNVLEKGRYPFEVLEIVNINHISKNGNVCFVVDILIDGWKRQRCYLVKHDGNGQKTRGSHMYHNFLYSIGIRSENKKVKIKMSQIVGGKGLVDVFVNKDNTENIINNFSSVKESTAPIDNVPSENESPKEVVNEEI